MSVALNHLIGYIHLGEAQVLHDPSLNLNAILSVCCLSSDCSAHLADSRPRPELLQPLDVPRDF
jgi:hypothetical protein